MDLFDEKGIQPMLIAEQVDPYDDEDSIYELKLDGCRCVAYYSKTESHLIQNGDGQQRTVCLPIYQVSGKGTV